MGIRTSIRTTPFTHPIALLHHTEWRYANVVHLSQTLYIRDAFKAAGAEVAEQDVLVEGERFRNIVARFGPASGKLLVVDAHYDSHGFSGTASASGKTFDPETHTPGADDNASGVAGLLELARLLARNPPPRPVELVAYTLEEGRDGGRRRSTGSIDQHAPRRSED